MRRPLSLTGTFRIVNGKDNVTNEEFDLPSEEKKWAARAARTWEKCPLQNNN